MNDLIHTPMQAFLATSLFLLSANGHNGRCNVTQEIVTHEFGHALGLANHFDGFGTNDTSSTAFWDVLATLYSNPQSTVTANLKVKHAAK